MDLPKILAIAIGLLLLGVIVTKLCSSKEGYLPREYTRVNTAPSFLFTRSQRKDGYPDMPEVDAITKAQLLEKSLKEGFAPDQNYLPPFQVKNATYWPSYYYSFPYNDTTYAWPPGMFSRMYNWYPGFSSGNGLMYFKRPNNEKGPMPRNAWIRKTPSEQNQYNYVSNRGEYYFDESDYQTLPFQ